MGYCVEQKESVFQMKAENKPKALEAIKAIDGIETWKYCDLSFLKDNTLEEALNTLCWDTTNYLDDEGNITDIYYEGEKLDDYILPIFNAIAPFVEADSFIEMMGEDGTIWRWVFNGKTCEEKYPKITWE
jgi:hypothetical protein